jgi:hypothetical protein
VEIDVYMKKGANIAPFFVTREGILNASLRPSLLPSSSS